MFFITCFKKNLKRLVLTDTYFLTPIVHAQQAGDEAYKSVNKAYESGQKAYGDFQVHYRGSEGERALRPLPSYFTRCSLNPPFHCPAPLSQAAAATRQGMAASAALGRAANSWGKVAEKHAPSQGAVDFAMATGY